MLPKETLVWSPVEQNVQPLLMIDVKLKLKIKIKVMQYELKRQIFLTHLSDLLSLYSVSFLFCSLRFCSMHKNYEW